MKTVVNESKNPLFKKLGLMGIGLCVLCCSLPIIGTAIGMGALASLAVYFEKIAIAVLIASGGLFTLWYFSKKKASSTCTTSCDINTGGACNCKADSINIQ